jgi:predicted transcriptional regulator
MARRSRLEIYFDILDVIGKGVTKPTRVMYKTNLSWETMQDIFETLIQGGFIVEGIEANGKRYQVTDKGRNALSYYQKSLQGLVDVEQVLTR